MPKKLSTEDQIEKLNKVQKLADESMKSSDLIKKLGALTVYSAIVDFYLIQTARLIEQVVLKSQLADGKKPFFDPRNDEYFYDNSVRSGNIIREVKKWLKFKPGTCTQEEVDRINKLGRRAMKLAEGFLKNRKIAVHHLGSPYNNIKDIEMACEKTFVCFHKFLEAQKDFFDTIGPSRFGIAELKYFY